VKLLLGLVNTLSPSGDSRQTLHAYSSGPVKGTPWQCKAKKESASRALLRNHKEGTYEKVEGIIILSINILNVKIIVSM
jgi:hypothetical protein